MPAKRSLRLEAAAESIKLQNEKPKMSADYDPSSYSPLTGTRQMTPTSASKRRAEARERRRQNDVADTGAAEPETSSRGQSSPKENAEILELFAKVEGSLNEFLQIRQHLTELQAAEGSRELGNLLGLDYGTLDLKAELKKTKVLNFGPKSKHRKCSLAKKKGWMVHCEQILKGRWVQVLKARPRQAKSNK